MFASARRARQVADLKDRLEVVEKRLKVIEADWDEWYDKFRRLYARLSKRVEREEKPVEDAPGPTIAARGYSTLNPLAARLLSGHHDGSEA